MIRRYIENCHNVVSIFGLKFKKINYRLLLSSTNERLDKLMLLEKCKILLDNEIFTFNYEDNLLKLFLPTAHRDAVQTPILQNETFFELENLEKVRKYINFDSYVLDAGANIGNHTLYFAKICNAKKVYSFEPMKTIYEILNKNISLNDLSNVETFNLALGEQSGKVSIERFVTGNLGGTRFKTDEKGNFPLVTLDQMNLEHLDFCKVDVEGHQLQFLIGAKQTLSKFKPTIWVEMLCPEKYACDPEEELDKPKKLLEEYGYVLKEKLTDIDYLYVHKDKY